MKLSVRSWHNPVDGRGTKSMLRSLNLSPNSWGQSSDLECWTIQDQKQCCWKHQSMLDKFNLRLLKGCMHFMPLSFIWMQHPVLTQKTTWIEIYMDGNRWGRFLSTTLIVRMWGSSHCSYCCTKLPFWYSSNWNGSGQREAPIYGKKPLQVWAMSMDIVLWTSPIKGKIKKSQVSILDGRSYSVW